MTSEIALPYSLAGFAFDQIEEEDGQIVIEGHSTTWATACPYCGEYTDSVHSQYTRSPRDLPSVGKPVQLRLWVKRFFCPNDACFRRTFVERFEEVLPFYSRRTKRLTDCLEVVGMEMGGEAGARVICRFAIPVSADTILRLLRRIELAEPGILRAIGVDDWAFKKGRDYGTIIVDLERHETVDLLPDREAKTLQTWLEEHPGIEVISRDRANAYIEGATKGAPDAIQVADRWHLLVNLSDAVCRMMETHPAELKAAAQLAQVNPPEEEIAPDTCEEISLPQEAEESAEPQPLSYREARFQEVKTLFEQGHGIREIARHLHMSRKTIRKYTLLDEFLPYQTPVRPSIIDPFRPYLERRIEEGCHNRRQLWDEIREMGYEGGYASVRYHLRDHPRPNKSPKAPRRERLASSRPLTPRQATWLLNLLPEDLNPEEKVQLERLLGCCPDAATVYPLVQRFKEMAQNLQADQFDQWLTDAEESGITQLVNFANGLRKDYAAVKAAFTFTWSNGQVEGQVNRLKTIKRQMYGRAKFDLLRVRVLHKAA